MSDMELRLDFSADTEADALAQLAACYQGYVGHELLNQLVSVQAYARAVLEDEADRLSDDGKMMLGNLADLAQRTDALARRLADIGRLLREPAVGPGVQVERIITEAVAEAKALGGRGDVRYDVHTAPCCAAVSPGLLYRVLLELLDNATRAVPDGRPGTIKITSWGDAGSCVVSVQDDGRGIGAADDALLTEPFAAARRGGGAGLGFFLVRQAAARWRGRVEVRSGPSGTSVTLTLPSVEPR